MWQGEVFYIISCENLQHQLISARITKMSDETIEAFIESGGPFAVVGASTDREKYGNKVLRCYLQNDLVAYPINRKATEVEGQQAYADLSELPEKVENISIITPTPITEKVVEEAATLGAKRLWMQPGAESDYAIQKAEKLGMEVIANGPCLLVVLSFKDI